MQRFVVPTALVAALSIAGCAYQQNVGFERSPRDAVVLAKALDGKVAGAPRACLGQPYTRDMTVVDEHTILFRDGRTTWRNDPPGGCSNLGRPGYAMVTRLFGSQYCRGDIVHVVDTSSGMFAGSCGLGDFVPYSRPRRG